MHNVTTQQKIKEPTENRKSQSHKGNQGHDRAFSQVLPKNKAKKFRLWVLGTHWYMPRHGTAPILKFHNPSPWHPMAPHGTARHKILRFHNPPPPPTYPSFSKRTGFGHMVWSEWFGLGPLFRLHQLVANRKQNRANSGCCMRSHNRTICA